MQIAYKPKEKAVVFIFDAEELRAPNPKEAHDLAMIKLTEALRIINHYGLQVEKFQAMRHTIYIAGEKPKHIKAYILIDLTDEFAHTFFKEFFSYMGMIPPYTDEYYYISNEDWTKLLEHHIDSHEEPTAQVCYFQEWCIAKIYDIAEVIGKQDARSALIKKDGEYELVLEIPYMRNDLLIIAQEFLAKPTELTFEQYLQGTDIIIANQAIEKLILVYS